MKKLNGSLYLVENTCFNKNTLEVFALDDMHVDVLKKMINNKKILNHDIEISEVLKQSGILEQDKLFLCEDNRFSPDFIAFRIVLGNICNLHCRDCFVSKHNADPIKMSTHDLCSILDKTFEYGKSRNIKYHFFGGEPLMMFDLIKIGVKRIEKAYVDGLIRKPIFTITSNATLINEEIVKFFKDHNFKVGVSIDGPKQNNDLIRGQGVFNKVRKAFQLLERYNVESWFLITPYNDIVDVFPAFITDELFRDFKFKSITLNTPFNGNNLSWLVDGNILADKILECHERVKDLDLIIESAASPVLYALSSGVKRKYPCSIADNQVMGSIAPDGRISYCAQYWSEDLFKKSFLGSFSFLTEYKKPKLCNSCIAENICGGPCLISYSKTKEIDTNKCKFYQRLLEKILKNPSRYLSDKQVSEKVL